MSSIQPPDPGDELIPPVPDDPAPAGEQGLPIRPGGRGNRGRWVGDRFIPANDIVEAIRGLLADNNSVGDIKRLMARKFGGSGRSFERYLAVARKRNCQMIGRTREEAKSDSLQQWTRLLAEQKTKKGKAEIAVEAADREAQRLKQIFDEASESDLAIAAQRLDRQLEVLARAEKRLASAQYWIVSYQHTIDRILGNLAPLEVKDLTDRKNELAHPTEPMTEKEADAELLRLLAKVRGDISTPSAN